MKFPIATRFIFLRDCVMFSQNTKVFESLIASSINLRSLAAFEFIRIKSLTYNVQENIIRICRNRPCHIRWQHKTTEINDNVRINVWNEVCYGHYTAGKAIIKNILRYMCL